MTNQKLATSTKWFWGFGQIAEGVKNSAFNAFLLFYYNQIVGVSATLTAIALGVAVLCDAISDPLVGSISDKYRSKWGRRHPFMVASVIPLAATLFLLFFPPDGMSEMFYFVWVLVFAISVRTFLTLYQIPHLALGAEIAPDYEDRNVLFSIGLLFGAIGGYGFYPIMLTLVFPEQEGLAHGLYASEGYPLMAGCAAIITSISILLCAWGTKGEIPNMSQPSGVVERLSPQRVFGELKIAFSNKSYRSIFFGLTFSGAVLAIEGAFGTFINVHFWELDTTEIRWIPVGILLGLPVGTILGAYLVRLLDKKWCLIIPAAVSIVNANLLVVLRLLDVLPPNGDPIILPLLVGSGFIGAIATPVVFITINSMFADITDEIELETGERQEGIVYSARAFAGKAANAFGTMAGGLALDLIAFPKQALPGTIDSDVIFNLGLVQGPMTSMFTLLALFLYFGYGLSRERHAEIVAQLQARRA